MHEETINRSVFVRRLTRLALPIIVQNLVNNSLVFLDTFMVGALGEKELAALTLCNSLFFIVTLFVFGLQSGCSVLIGQYWGKRDTAAINRIIGLGSYCAGAVTIAFAILVFFFHEPILSITSNNPELVSIAAEYARIVAFSYVLNGFSLMYLSAQRSMENPAIGTVTLVLSMLINTVLNYALIFGHFGLPAMGVAGAALATLIARGIEFCITYGYALFFSPFKLMPKLFFRPGKTLVPDFIRYCGPVVVNETLWGAGYAVFPIIMGHLPASASGVAAFTIAVSVERMTSSLYFGVGNAAAVMIGNAIGRGEPDVYGMGKRLVRVALLFGAAAAALVALLIESVVSPFVFPLFNASGETIALAKIMLYITVLSIPARALNFTVIVGVLRGGGDVVAAALIDIVSMFGLAIPLAVVVAFALNWGILAVYVVMCAEEIWKFFANVWRFRSRRWIRDVTRELPEEVIA